MFLLLKVTSDNEFADGLPRYAIVPMTPQLASSLLARLDSAVRYLETEPGLDRLECRDDRCRWRVSVPWEDDDSVSIDPLDLLSGEPAPARLDDSPVLLADDPADRAHEGDIRTEISGMALCVASGIRAGDSVWWHAYPKYFDGELTTDAIDRATLEKIARMETSAAAPSELLSSPPPPPRAKVIVTVEGGIVQEVEAPPGVEVFVRDYDVEGCDATAENLPVDERGDPYAECRYYADPAPEPQSPPFSRSSE